LTFLAAQFVLFANNAARLLPVAAHAVEGDKGAHNELRRFRVDHSGVIP
jgi:hypothetical protein